MQGTAVAGTGHHRSSGHVVGEGGARSVGPAWVPMQPLGQARRPCPPDRQVSWEQSRLVYLMQYGGCYFF